MNVRHDDRKLERLETDVTFRIKRFGPDVTKAFRKVMAWIRAAKDEQAFYNLKSLHYEKLRGSRAGQHSLRLNDQWRLILRIELQHDGNVVVVIEIADYH